MKKKTSNSRQPVEKMCLLGFNLDMKVQFANF
jgi:hypothetical protein